MGVDLKLTYRLYEKLKVVIPDLGSLAGYSVCESNDGLPLCCDVLEVGNDYRRIALGHYWQLTTGEQVPDVLFEVNVFLDWELAEAVSYEFGGWVEDAYAIDGEPPVLSIHRRINRFLEQWLDLLALQGYCLVAGAGTAAGTIAVSVQQG
jgi:uncharacterized protein YqiB (DUF1249 family)